MSESSQAVFLSYTSQDAEAARRVCESLRAAGIEVWLDQSELRGGDASEIHASLGEIDEAVRWFHKAYDDRSPDMVYAQVSSRLNPRLAASAGFREIMDRMAFPTSAK
jgi:TIR domain